MDALVLKKYETLPDNLQKEVVDFIDFLESKYLSQKQNFESLAQKRASLFGNAKGLITILPEFENIPDGFEEYK